MIKTILKILLISFLFACHPVKKTAITIGFPVEIAINKDQAINVGESIEIVFENTHSNSIIVYYPKKLNIEKLEDANWRKLKILECPCDAPCQASAEKVMLKSGEQIKLSWNLKESWCGPRSSAQIRETIFRLVSEGRYRIIFNVKSLDGIESSICKEFNIIQ